MKNYKDLILLAEQLVDQDTKLENKYTKAESGRIRSTIMQIQKLAVDAKRDLIAKDKSL